MFGRGYGQDTIDNTSVSTEVKTDTLLLQGLNAADVALVRSGNSLIISVIGTTDTITLGSYFIGDGAGQYGTTYAVDQIKFADGTSWDLARVKAEVIKGSAGDDSLVGYESADTITGQNGNDYLYGHGGNDTLLGGNGNDILMGEAGDDTLDGGAGTDRLIGGVGSDTYLFGRGYGQDTIDNTSVSTEVKTDTLLLQGLNVADVTLSRSGNSLLISVVGTTDTMTLESYFIGDGAGQYGSTYAVEQIKFADGTTWAYADVKNRLLSGTSANDQLTGFSSNDILSGFGGDDVLTDTVGNNLLQGGAGNDTLNGGSGKELLIGGTGNDTIDTSTGADVIAFNRGDGQDIVKSSTGKDNTLSLGKGITYADLAFQKTGNDLVFTTGANEQVTFKDWYASTNNHSVANLQVMIEGTSDYDTASANSMNNKKVQQFNFDSLVTAFDQARTANPSLTSWSLSSSLLSFYLSGSDTAAIGGDLAYQYGTVGNLSGISMLPAQTVLSNANFGSGSQNLQTAASLQDQSPRLA